VTSISTRCDGQTKVGLGQRAPFGLTRRLFGMSAGGLVFNQVLGCATNRQEPRVGVARTNLTEQIEVDTDGSKPSSDEVSAVTTVDSPVGTEGPPPPRDQTPRLRLPPRPKDAPTGSVFLGQLEGLGRAGIDAAVLKAVREGNVPDYQRKLVPLRLEAPSGAVALLHVMSDYLAIGSDDDFIRMPMTSAAAQQICDELDMSLPTTKLVDAIFQQADGRLPPSYIDGGPTEDELADFQFHQQTVEERRLKAGYTLGTLLAGHKKDIVLSVRLAEREDRVAIYGWHKKDGKVIQPLSCTHSCRYADYSHGVRLINQSFTIDGEAHSVKQALADEQLAELLSDEGPLPLVSYSTTLPEYTGPKKRKKKS
jgi:hypothetical protein